MHLLKIPQGKVSIFWEIAFTSRCPAETEIKQLTDIYQDRSEWRD